MDSDMEELRLSSINVCTIATDEWTSHSIEMSEEHSGIGLMTIARYIGLMSNKREDNLQRAFWSRFFVLLLI